MDPALAFRGFVLGFTIAAAVGPISLLVIRRTLAEGRLYGLVSGLGVATADATYGAIAAFGLGALTDALVNARQVLGLVGGAFLLWLAWQTIRSTPTEAAAVTTRRRGYAGAYLSILGLTMANPMTILSFGALFAGLGVTRGATGDATLVVAWRPAWLDHVVGRPDDAGRDAAGEGHADLDPPDQPRVRLPHRGVRDRGDRLGPRERAPRLSLQRRSFRRSGPRSGEK